MQPWRQHWRPFNGPWKKFTAAQRGQALHKLGDLTLEYKDELVWLDATPIGKPLPFAHMEVEMAANTLKCRFLLFTIILIL